MSLGFIIPALLAGIGVAAVALLIHRKKWVQDARNTSKSNADAKE
jgi:TRAP-type C4-dicarboxylate transport system permease large subunit